ncbi:hypothetical protein LXA43DRAFT_1061439 [Ganoderma leucocontextum]|nr:hypothetical protein LXA43DRAFT_1061439 [Ganoderma leucocontextum]
MPLQMPLVTECLTVVRMRWAYKGFVMEGLLAFPGQCYLGLPGSFQFSDGQGGPGLTRNGSCRRVTCHQALRLPDFAPRSPVTSSAAACDMRIDAFCGRRRACPPGRRIGNGPNKYLRDVEKGKEVVVVPTALAASSKAGIGSGEARSVTGKMYTCGVCCSSRQEVVLPWHACASAERQDHETDVTQLGYWRVVGSVVAYVVSEQKIGVDLNASKRVCTRVRIAELLNGDSDRKLEGRGHGVRMVADMREHRRRGAGLALNLMSREVTRVDRSVPCCCQKTHLSFNMPATCAKDRGPWEMTTSRSSFWRMAVSSYWADWWSRAYTVSRQVYSFSLASRSGSPRLRALAHLSGRTTGSLVWLSSEGSHMSQHGTVGAVQFVVAAQAFRRQTVLCTKAQSPSSASSSLTGGCSPVGGSSILVLVTRSTSREAVVFEAEFWLVLFKAQQSLSVLDPAWPALHAESSGKMFAVAFIERHDLHRECCNPKESRVALKGRTMPWRRLRTLPNKPDSIDNFTPDRDVVNVQRERWIAQTTQGVRVADTVMTGVPRGKKTWSLPRVPYFLRKSVP